MAEEIRPSPIPTVPAPAGEVTAPTAAPAVVPDAAVPDASSPDTAAPLPDPASQPAPELFPLVYDQLRQLARQRMAAERAGHTLQATALVHEAYMRLSSRDDARFRGPGHFYAAAAEAMRRILIDYARGHGRLKRGDARRRRLPADVLDLAAAPEPEEILSFDEALTRLEQQSPETAAVVRMRFYAGLSVEETAAALEVSARTVNREWSYARAWLFRELEKEVEP